MTNGVMKDYAALAGWLVSDSVRYLYTFDFGFGFAQWASKDKKVTENTPKNRKKKPEEKKEQRVCPISYSYTQIQG